MQQIDRRKISRPVIRFSKRALKQVQLIAENDYTLTGKIFRIQIQGKGCDGFNYSTGFSHAVDDDFVFELSESIKLHLDPFTAFYLQRAEVRYQTDQSSGEEGFVITNLDQAQFEGKFWKDDPSKEPPVLRP